MNSNTISAGILKAIAVIAGVLLLLYFLVKIQAVLTYVAIASVISLIGLPVVRFLRTKLKLRNTLAVILTMFVMIGLLFGLVRMFIPLIVEQGHNLSLLNIDELQRNIEDLYRQISEYFAINNFNFEKSLKESNLLSKLNFSVIPEFLNSLISGFGSFSIGLFSVLFIAFFFLKDNRLLEEIIMVLVPDGKEARSKKSLHIIKDLLSRYFVGLIFQILILFIIYTVVLLIFGIKNAVVIAFLCALLNLIPYIGPLIGAFLMVVLTMSSNLGASFSEVILPKTTYVMIGFMIGQLVDNFFSQPFIFSKSVKSHPLEIFLVIIIGGLLFGVIGMITAVPSYTALKVIMKEFLSENKIVKELTKNI